MERFIDASRHKRRVLVVDDELINRELLGAILENEYEVVKAENGQAAWDLLNAEDADYSLILLDLLMPVMDGFTLMKLCFAHETIKSIPVIVMTSEKSAEVKSIRMGASDFIAKPYDMPDVILARCQRIIEFNEDKTIIRYTEKDALTGLYTKQYFDEYLRLMMTELHAEMDAVEIRIDRFHLMKELFGREEANCLLKEAAALIMRELAASRGIACRTEDNSLLVYAEHREDYESLIARLQEELSESTALRGINLRAGIHEYEEGVPLENRFERARAACERVCGQYEVLTARYSSELHQRSMYRQKLIGDMQDAIDNRDFIVYYQPKYRIQGEKPVLTSAEALIRWKHRELGMLSPGVFIPLFEENGLIRYVDRFVWREAAAQIKRWKEQYGVSLPVSVNVSRMDIFDPELISKLSALLSEFSLEPHELMLEITESAYADNAEALIETAEALREKGFRIEMDDFGSGYSSLNMLTSIPIDVLKMDMKFIRNMFRDEKSLGLVKLVLDIAGFLEVPVVAEGVEEQRQLDALKKMGCEIVQGYYFSPPLPADKFEELLRQQAG